MSVFLSHFNLLLILSPIPKSHLKLLAAAALKVTCRKWKSVLFFLPLSSSSLRSHVFLHKSYLLSFQTVCLKREKKRKKPNLQSHSMLTRIMKLFFLGLSFTIHFYLYLALLSHPNIYVTGRLCDTLEKIKALEKDRNGFEPGSAIYYPV